MDEAAIVERLAKVEARANSNTHRIDKVESDQEALQSLATSVAVMANKQDTMDSKLERIEMCVTEIKDKPAKRWENVVDKLIAAAVGALLAWMAAGMPGAK